MILFTVSVMVQWDIKRLIVSGNTAVVECFFQCDYEESVDGFDGVTVAEFNADMNIYEGCCRVKNYLSVLQ